MYNKIKSYSFIISDLRSKRIKLETSVESLIKNASVDKAKVSEQMNQIKSSVALMKTGLTTKINHFAVSKLLGHLYGPFQKDNQ